MNDKPTGEWTGDDDGVLLPLHRFIGQYAKEIAEAHNAALDAEREQVPPPVNNKFVAEGCAQFGERPASTEAVFIMNRSLMLEIEQLKKQLATEKEKVKDAHVYCEQLYKDIAYEREQRAAEREHVAALQRLESTLQEQLATEREQGVKALAERSFELHECQKQLAAERGKVKELEAWKESAMSVMPDFQAIGKELGLTLGESVHDKILPAIHQLIAEREKVRGLVDALTVVAKSEGNPDLCHFARGYLNSLAKVDTFVSKNEVL